jgi:hypothetical protein
LVGEIVGISECLPDKGEKGAKYSERGWMGAKGRKGERARERASARIQKVGRAVTPVRLHTA